MVTRPVIFGFDCVKEYLGAMLKWQRHQDPTFSVRKKSLGLKRCSPALVTKVLKGQRKLTTDRISDFAKLLNLEPSEKTYLERWLQGATDDKNGTNAARVDATKSKPISSKRKEGETHLLSSWLHVYVKDAARLQGFHANATALYQLLGGIASIQQIQRSLNFLLREGYLRRTLDHKVVENDVVVTTTDDVPNVKIRQFHKKALEIAKRGIDVFPTHARRQSAIILPVNEDSLEELKKILKESYERIVAFSEEHSQDNQKLVQVIISMTPVGGFDSEPH